MFLTQLIYDSLLTVAYPQICAICSCSVEQRKFGAACESCWSQTRVFTGSETICSKCGVLSHAQIVPELISSVRCRSCDSQSFTAARAIGLYEGALRESVLLLKRQPNLSQYVQDLLIETARRSPLNLATRIIPVPLHQKRRRERGFNQASIMADVLSRALKLSLDEVSLVRVSSTDRYRAGLDAKGREDTVNGAFEVRHPKLIANEQILLVDDVFTTGATVSVCSEALLAAGAQSVFVLTLARARARTPFRGQRN